MNHANENLWTRLRVAGPPEALMNFNRQAVGKLELVTDAEGVAVPFESDEVLLYWVEVLRLHWAIVAAEGCGLQAREMEPGEEPLV